MKKVAIAIGLWTGVVCGEMKVEVSGIRVVTEGYSSKKDAMMGEIRAFNWSSGTSVALLVKSEGAKIVSLDEKKSKLSVFADDQGTDFMKVKSQFTQDPYSFEWSEVSEDGVALGTTIESEGLPAKGAKSLVIKGELFVVTGSKFEEKKSGKLKVEKGSSFEAGDFKFKISEAGKPKWGEDPLAITLETSKDPSELQGIAFYGADGKEIESESSGSGSMGMFGKMTHTLSFSLKEKPAEIVVGVSLWTDLEVVKVPLDLKVGAGL